MSKVFPWNSLTRLLAPVVLLAAGGCAGLVEDAVVATDRKELTQEISLVEGGFVAFRDCLKARGGSCTGDVCTAAMTSSTLDRTVAALPPGHPAAEAHQVLRHPVGTEASALHDAVSARASAPTLAVSSEQDKQGRQTVEMNLRIGKVHHFMEALLSTVGIGAWDTLHDHCQGLSADPGDEKNLMADCRRIAFIRGYLEAYVRNGRFVAVEVEEKNPGTNSEVKKLVASLTEKVDDELSNVIQVSDVGFVSRDSSFEARLPTLELVLDPTAQKLLSWVDESTGQTVTGRTDLSGLGVATDTSGVGTGARVGAEIVRVYLEALFDAAEGLPAVHPLNAGGAGPTGLSLETGFQLPLFQSPMGHVDAMDLTRVTRFSNALALKTRIAVGRVVSGLGPLNLNNVPLESALTEIVATTVRKAAEKAGWCWYACNLDIETARLRQDGRKTVQDGEKAIAENVGNRLEAEKKHLAGEVSLRLRLHR